MSDETPKEKKKTGRKPKITPLLIEEICKWVRSGASHEDAMIMVGLSEAILYEWKKHGKEDPASIYGTFLEDITKARIEAKMRKIASVEARCKEDGAFALEMLARTYQSEYGRKDHLVVDSTVNAKVEGALSMAMSLSPEAIENYRRNRDVILGKNKKA